MAVYVSCKPVEIYRVTSKYGARGSGFHSGLDLGAKTRGVAGDSIFAVERGKVVFVGYDANGYGNYLIIEHTALNYCTLYAHMSKVIQSVGNTVDAGQIIGLMGTTGHSTGVHLHFEIRACLYSKFWTKNPTKNPKYSYCINPQPVLEGGSVGVPDTQNGGYISENSIADVNYSYSYEKAVANLDTLQTTGNYLYGRKYRIMVFDNQNNGYDISDLRVVFNVTKSLTLDGTTGTVTIYNLNTVTENDIIMNCNRVTIEAGYEGLFGLIYDGDVIQAIRGVENGVDYYVTLISMQCERLLSSGFVDYTIARGQTRRDVVKTVCEVSTNSVGVGSLSSALSKQKYIRGKVVFGKSIDILSQIARTDNTQLYFNNGKVNLTSVTDLNKDDIIYLDSTSGLIGTPQQSDYYVTFQCLLNPRIDCDKLVKIPNEQILEMEYSTGTNAIYMLDSEGIYRIIKVTYSGDTRGQDWYIDCTATSQAGTLPAIISDIIGGSSNNSDTSSSGDTYDTESYYESSGSSGAGTIKTFEPYTAITSKSSLAYKLQHSKTCYTDRQGFRRFDTPNKKYVALYMVAMGTFYGKTGDILQIQLTSGKSFSAIMGDVKADKDTDALNKYCVADGSEVEFIIDKSVFYVNSKKARTLGDCSVLGFEGKVRSVTNKGSYTKY